MRQKIIQFVTGTTTEIAQQYPLTGQQRLILNELTGQVFWDYNNKRYKVNTVQKDTQADWAQTDQTKLSYIRNKPQQTIDKTAATEGRILIQTPRIPLAIELPDGKIYHLQSDSMQKVQSQYIINITRYLAYSNMETLTACKIYTN